MRLAYRLDEIYSNNIFDVDDITELTEKSMKFDEHLSSLFGICCMNRFAFF